MWYELDFMLVIDTTRGRLIVEMRPDLAPNAVQPPNAVQRIRLLAREGVYDGLQNARVVRSAEPEFHGLGHYRGGAGTRGSVRGGRAIRIAGPDASRAGGIRYG